MEFNKASITKKCTNLHITVATRNLINIITAVQHCTISHVDELNKTDSMWLTQKEKCGNKIYVSIATYLESKLLNLITK